MVNNMTEVNLDRIREKTIEVPKFAYAGFWIRLVAYVIDMIVVSSIASIINGIIFSNFAIELPFGLGVYQSLRWIIVFVYFSLMTYKNEGQTIGKMICGIRVVSATDEKLTLFQVITRETFGRYIQDKIKILYIIIAVTPLKQSLLDMLCDTVVIKDNVVDYLFEN